MTADGISLTPQFGVVVLNWNNADDTIDCLEALRLCDPPPARLVVVDNGSADDSIERISAWVSRAADLGRLPDTSVLSTGENKGFAGGTNVGIRALVEIPDITHVVLLNNDATLRSDFFARAADLLRSHPNAGLIGPTIFHADAPHSVWYAGGIEIPSRALFRHVVSVPHDRRPAPTEFVTGCVMVIARPLIAAIGMLPECYFPAYWEDSEYSSHARRAGFPVLYAPDLVAFHKVGSTVRAAGIDVPLERAKNRLRVFYVRRNYSGSRKFVALAYLAVTKPARAIVEMAKGNVALGHAIIAGTLSGFLSNDAVRR